jgi:hypothetical protein
LRFLSSRTRGEENGQIEDATEKTVEEISLAGKLNHITAHLRHLAEVSESNSIPFDDAVHD